MKLEATSRLCATAEVTYADYRMMLASLDTASVTAFELTLPGPLRKLKEEISQLCTYLKEAKDIAVVSVLRAFKERSVFALLKGLGFSLVKITKAIMLALRLPSAALFAALDALSDAIGDTKLFKALAVSERLERLEAVIRKHPILSKVTGLVIAALIFIIYIEAPFIGDVAFDFDLVESMLAALKGNYSLTTMFTSPDAMHTLLVLIVGAATGGVSLLDYGAGYMARSLKFLGAHGEDISAVLLAIFYAGAKRVRIRVRPPTPLIARRTQDWYSRMTPEQRIKYLKKYPGTKFHDKTTLAVPD